MARECSQALPSWENIPLPKRGKKFPRLTGPRSMHDGHQESCKRKGKYTQSQSSMFRKMKSLTEISKLSSQDRLNILLVTRRDVRVSKDGVSIGYGSYFKGTLDHVGRKLFFFIRSEPSHDIVDPTWIFIRKERRFFALELSCHPRMSAGG